MTARKPAVRPLCGRCEQGNIYDESVDPPVVTRCPCRRPQATPEAERDAALTATADANPDALRDALRIIRDAAHANPVISPNSVRGLMEIADIPGPVRGAAWRQAAANKWVRRAGFEPSTDPGTHGHEIKLWESLIFGHKAAS